MLLSWTYPGRNFDCILHYRGIDFHSSECLQQQKTLKKNPKPLEIIADNAKVKNFPHYNPELILDQKLKMHSGIPHVMRIISYIWAGVWILFVLFCTDNIQFCPIYVWHTVGTFYLFSLKRQYKIVYDVHVYTYRVRLVKMTLVISSNIPTTDAPPGIRY